jgi:hypothetical protein
MTNGTEDAEYVYDPKQTSASAFDEEVGVTIKVKHNGTVTVLNHTGSELEDIHPLGQLQLPELPPGAQVRAAYIVHTTNPTWVWCLHGGQWRQICW